MEGVEVKKSPKDIKRFIISIFCKFFLHFLPFFLAPFVFILRAGVYGNQVMLHTRRGAGGEEQNGEKNKGEISLEVNVGSDFLAPSILFNAKHFSSFLLSKPIHIVYRLSTC